MRNQTSFRLTTTVLPTDKWADHKAKVTQVINKVDSSGNKFYPSFSEETVVITNDDRTVMETTRATADGNWNITFIKRWLSDDASATEVANRALTWTPWSIAFITAWASDFIDVDDDLTWSGKQTYTQWLVSQWDATYKGLLITEKGVQYPSFDDTTALEAYDSPFGWMFATVEDTGELYRYNAVTEQWDLVSTTELSDFIIREDTTVPSWAADNVITLLPNLTRIYLGDDLLVNSEKYADVLLVAWWGSSASYWWWWGGGVYLWERIWLGDKTAFSITIWAAWNNSDWGSTTMAWICTVYWGKKTTWWDATESWCAWLKLNRYAWWKSVTTTNKNGYWWWGGAFWKGWDWKGASTVQDTIWGDWWEWLISDISGSTQYYGRWGAWWTSTDGGYHWTYWTTHTWYWVGGGIQWTAQSWVVIIRYPTDWSYGINSATWWTVTTSWGYTIHTFTENGTFTIVS